MPSGGESPELRCLTAISQGRLYFFNSVATYAELHFTPSEPARFFDNIIPTLQSDHSYHLAEFFYLARELNLYDPVNLKTLLDKHNADMKALLHDNELKRPQPSKITWMGIRSAQRVKAALFSDEQKQKLLCGDNRDVKGKVILDQSDISKLLVNLMSFEICRQTILVLAESQLLCKGEHSGRVLVSSPGILEEYFHAHLQEIDRRIGK